MSGDTRELPAHAQAALLFVCQESLTNVRRHAGVTEVSVELAFLADSVCLKVRDDGTGFDVEEVRAKGRGGGFGLSGMAQRARSLGGSFTLSSTPGEGTAVEIALPV